MDETAREQGSFVTAQRPLPILALPPPSPTSSEPPVTQLSRTWPRSAQCATAALLGGILTLLGVHLWAGGWGTRPSEREPGLLLDLNAATRAELLQVRGIGPGLADRILAYRKAHGPFRRAEDLCKVPGIGPRTWQGVRDFVFVAPSTREDEVDRAPPTVRQQATASPKQTAKSKKELALAGQTININEAGVTELQKLPGVGAKLSQRIIDERARRRFASADELRRVPGIGPKTLEKVRPYITISDDQSGLARIE